MPKKSIDSDEPSKLDILDSFVLAGVLTILLTRAFLAITDYPQIGNDSLHVAHVLYGGAILVAAFLFLLLASKPNRLIAALVGGIGFGLFIDEVGKFITQDNDYFYEPAIGIIYIAFLCIWFIARIVIVRMEGLPLLSPAEWPSKQWQKQLVIIWCTVQASIAVMLLVALVLVSSNNVSEQLSIPTTGIWAAILYGAFLAYGLYRYRGGFYSVSAHDLRGATIFGIAVVYPFLYLNHPSLATISIAPTLMTLIALSEVSFMSLIRKLTAQPSGKNSKH